MKPVLAILCLTFSAGAQPAFPVVTNADGGGPITNYARKAEWQASATPNVRYALIVNGETNWTSNTNWPVNLVGGTNHLAVYAVASSGLSAGISINYLIASKTDYSSDIECSADDGVKWNKTNSIPVETYSVPSQPTDTKLAKGSLFRLRAWKREYLDERPVP